MGVAGVYAHGSGRVWEWCVKKVTYLELAPHLLLSSGLPPV